MSSDTPATVKSPDHQIWPPLDLNKNDWTHNDTLKCAIFVALASAFWVPFSIIHNEPEMAYIFAAAENVSLITIAGILFHYKGKFAHSIKMTMMVAFSLLAIELPFYLHFDKALSWSASATPFFFLPLFVTYALERGHHDRQEQK